MDKLPGVLWAYRITSWKPIGISSFALTYGMEAIIPIGLGRPHFERKSMKRLILMPFPNLNMTDELREAATVLIASYQQIMSNLYNRHVK